MTDDLVRQLLDHFAPDPPERLGVAVSGGGDSVALLHLLHLSQAQHGMTLEAVTVDHGLRAGSAEEAQGVGRFCASLGIEHTILHWSDWDGRGNLQDAARRARLSLIGDWALARGIKDVALGHTQDDQAETVLMRLARGAGVDGLSGMSPRRVSQGVTWHRPLLGLSRRALRAALVARGIDWVEDPSNDDSRFERVKARQALALLAPLGIDAGTLAQVAENMNRARIALSWQTFLAAQQVARPVAGAVGLQAKLYRTLPDEIARRLLVGILAWITGAPYPPRRGAVLGLIEALKEGRDATLEGCHAHLSGDTIWVFREYNAVRDLSCPPDALWDGRWRIISGEAQDGVTIRALGDAGLDQCPDWRAAECPRALLRATPAVWKGRELIAAPLADYPGNWHAELVQSEDTFFAALLSH